MTRSKNPIFFPDIPKVLLVIEGFLSSHADPQLVAQYKNHLEIGLKGLPTPMAARPPSETDPLFSGHQVWLDFWKELIHFLSPRTVYRLSCVSKGFNSFAWNHLIPECGMDFDAETPPDTLSLYLSRTPILSKLKLRSATFPALLAIRKIQKLKQLSIYSPLPERFWTFASHLTDLESLYTPFNFKKVPFALTALKKLHTLKVSRPKSDLLKTMALLTQLVSLDVFCPEDTVFKILAPLTNLQHLSVWGGIQEEFDLCNWKKLTYLSANFCPCPRNISDFTNLGHLSVNGVNRDMLAGITASLTNLKCLQLPFAPKLDFSPLTKITRLVIESEATLESVRSLQFLPNLTELIFFRPEPLRKPVAMALKNLTNLTTLEVCTNYLDFLSTHSKLKSLTISCPKPKPGNFRNISHLTNLETFDIAGMRMKVPSEEVKFFRPLSTCLNSLFINRDCDRLLQEFYFLTNLQNLDLTFSDVTPKGILSISQNFQELRKLVIEDSCDDGIGVLEDRVDLVPLLKLQRLESFSLCTDHLSYEDWKYVQQNFGLQQLFLANK